MFYQGIFPNAVVKFYVASYVMDYMDNEQHPDSKSPVCNEQYNNLIKLKLIIYLRYLLFNLIML